MRLLIPPSPIILLLLEVILSAWTTMNTTAHRPMYPPLPTSWTTSPSPGPSTRSICPTPATRLVLPVCVTGTPLPLLRYLTRLLIHRAQGHNYSNQETYDDDYVRKHNPLALFDSVALNNTRARQIKNFTDFEDDLKNKKLPQWAFITPNMTNDAHDTNITFASKWERSWVSKLLKDDYFMKDTLLLLTFDEDDTYTKTNRVFSILLGGAVPDHLKGTKDDTFYTHYSTIASVSANWGLPSLGRWDCGANLLEIVANKTGYVNWDVDTTNLRLNETYPGPLSTNELSKYSPVWPVPLTSNTKCSAGHGILESVRKTFAGHEATYEYTSPYPWDAKSKYNTKVTATRGSSTASASPTPTNAASSGAAPATAMVGALMTLFAYLLI